MTASGLRLTYHEPAPRLRAFISSYYVFEVGASHVSDVLRAELAQVRFMLSGHGYIAYGCEPYQPMPVASLAGPSGGAIRFEAFGPFRLVGVGLLPAGWAALVGESADRHADRLSDLADIAPALVRSTTLRMWEAPDDQSLVAAVDAFFAALADRARQPPLWFTRTTDDWLVASPSPAVDTLVSALGMSNRQVERMMLRVYGASPKYLSRKYRALQAAVRLGLNPQQGWQGAAGSAYYDQSHFIRDFRQFIGMTPGEFVRRDAPWITRLTMAKRAVAPSMPKLLRVT